MVSAWRNFKNIFFQTTFHQFTIIFRPEMLNFHPYSILTGETIVVFVIYCVLKANNFETKTIGGQYVFFRNKTAEIFPPLLPIINSVFGHEADEPTTQLLTFIDKLLVLWGRYKGGWYIRTFIVMYPKVSILRPKLNNLELFLA